MEQQITRLYVVNTINCWQEGWNLKKMRPEIAGWGGEAIENVQKEVEAICQREGLDLDDPRMIELAIDTVHQRLNGQAVRRLDSNVVGMDIDYDAIEEPYII
ncbi:hypothetical protein GP486_003770 [Trichoglossum hirsutum]|uniref:Uncharacterized protein n=1 Tax=Trichoglossum hirsutum TaxID=265104 RepID=A0A9P8RQ75_9PEZI|nr:hypothetical protein GP486_003770 [Trichoglossum hirsutum]